MAITYTWKVTSIKTKDEAPHQGVVVQTYWTKTGTDEHGHTGTFAGATPFTAADVPPDQFIAFEDLTEQMVLSWIQAVVTGGYEEHVNSQIQKQIDEHHKPVSEQALPWAAQTTSESTQ